MVSPNRIATLAVVYCQCDREQTNWHLQGRDKNDSSSSATVAVDVVITEVVANVSPMDSSSSCQEDVVRSTFCRSSVSFSMCSVWDVLTFYTPLIEVCMTKWWTQTLASHKRFWMKPYTILPQPQSTQRPSDTIVVWATTKADWFASTIAAVLPCYDTYSS